MITVTIKMKVSPEKSKELLQTVLSIIKSMRDEEGCVSYHFYQDLEDEKKFRLVGEWERQEDMNNHLRSERFGVLLGGMNLLQEPPDIRFGVVSYTAGVEAINMVHGKQQNENKPNLKG